MELKEIIKERTEKLERLRSCVINEEEKIEWLRGVVAAAERDLSEDERVKQAVPEEEAKKIIQ